MAMIIIIKIGYWLFTNTDGQAPISDQGQMEIGQVVYNPSQSCPIPKYYDSVRYPKVRKSLPPLICPVQTNLAEVNNGTVRLLFNGTCSSQCIQWKTDFEFQLNEPKILKNSQPATCSYAMIHCYNKKSRDYIRQVIFSPVRLDHLISKSVTALKGKPKPNDVIIIGIDSMSYHAYEYHLPKTFATFHKNLKGVSFKKFNTMGDGTTVNIQAFLTGTKDTETYETRKRIKGSRSVDDLNWIWKHYKEKGYVTMYTEEMTKYGTFQYRLNGFEQQPTDFYLRTPIMAAEDNGLYKKFCFGSQPLHSEYFKFFNEFQKSYHDVPKFSFVFFAMMSHDDNKYVNYMDNELSQFIASLRTKNPEALIILYSDHGHRFTSRLTMAGKYEERLPFLGISLPKSEEVIRPVLVENSEILISGLDLHATLEDFIGIYTPSRRNRHMSLFRPLPNNRKCSDIDSLPHWCSCLNWKTVDNPNSNNRMVETAHAVVETISNFTNEDRELCANLTLDKILMVYRLDANEAVLKFKKSSDVDGFVPDLSDNIRQTVHWYRMTLRTKPGDAEYDLTLSIADSNLNDGSKIAIKALRPEDVSRINRYAPWIKCLKRRKDKFYLVSDIRKFCICRDAL